MVLGIETSGGAVIGGVLTEGLTEVFVDEEQEVTARTTKQNLAVIAAVFIP